MGYLKELFKLSFYTILLITFVIGGFLQLFIGIPNTLISFIVIGILLFFVLNYFFFKNIAIINTTVMLFFVFGFLIVFSGIINGTQIFKVLIYLIFVLLPLSLYWFFKINIKEKYLEQNFINRIFFYIACAQLPIMLLQKFGYPLLVGINQSNQGIIQADIMFGSLFLKADHALGFLLLFNIFNIIQHNQYKQITKYPVFAFFYLGLTIMVSESNVTKLLLFILAGYYVYKMIPKKIKLIGLVLSVIFMAMFYKPLFRIPAVAGEIHFIKNEYNVKSSYRNYEKTIAKRPQVVIAYASKIPIRYIGNGPYSYFNIITGKFANTQHFSQIIWTYADLGIIGLIVFLLLLYEIVKGLNLRRLMTISIFGVCLIYAFMTTIFSDVAIMFICLCLLQSQNYKKNNELTYSTLP